MKKINYLLILIICLGLVLGLAACGDNNSSNNDDSEIPDSTVYTVTCEQSDYYTFGGTVSAMSGANAIVKLKSNYEAYEITGCTFNGEACVKTSANDAETQEYSFTMPQSNVVIKVLYRWNDLSVAGTNKFLSFDSDNQYNTTSAKGDSSYNNDQYWGDPLILNYNTNAGFMTIVDNPCISSNQAIIPNDAISVKNITSNTSNVIIGGKIIIDRSKINVGTAQIVLRVKSGNSSSYDAIIVATINVQ